MIHRIAFLLVFVASCYAVDSSQDKKAAPQPPVAEIPMIVMDADFATWSDTSDKDKVEYRFVITITNVSKDNITIPLT
jgi:hypothetical protein